MAFFKRLSMIFTFSMMVTLLCSVLLLALGVVLYRWPGVLVDRYLDPAVRQLHHTRLLINSQESIVPTKDDLPDELDLGKWTTNAALGLLTVSSATMVFSLFGILAFRLRRRLLLALLTLMIAVGLTIQYVFFFKLIDLDSNFHTELKSELVQMLHSHYEVGARTNSTFTFLANSVMLMARCCGVTSPLDLMTQNWTFVYDLEGKHHEISVIFPPACCKNRFIQRGFAPTLACVRAGALDNINNIGCYYKILQLIADRWGTAIKWTAIFVFVSQVFQLTIVLTFLFRIHPQEKVSSQQALIARIKDEMLAKMNKCTDAAPQSGKTSPQKRCRLLDPNTSCSPHANHSTVDRATEIW